jgi:hypothetical protein
MSYMKEEKQAVNDELDVISRKQGLRVSYVEAKKNSFFWPGVLVATGLTVIAICIVVYGV